LWGGYQRARSFPEVSAYQHGAVHVPPRGTWFGDATLHIPNPVGDAGLRAQTSSRNSRLRRAVAITRPVSIIFHCICNSHARRGVTQHPRTPSHRTRQYLPFCLQALSKLYRVCWGWANPNTHDIRRQGAAFLGQSPGIIAPLGLRTDRFRTSNALSTLFK